MSQDYRYGSILEKRVASKLANIGMRVTMEPNPDCLPESNIKYRPDILAKSPDGINYIIEVKSSVFMQGMERYFEYSRSLPSDRMWKFVIMTEREVDQDIESFFIPYGQKLSTTIKMIHDSRAKLDLLAEGSRLDEQLASAIFLVKFSNLESSLSLLAEKFMLPIGALESKIIADYLYSEGEIDYSLYEQLIYTISNRNKISHNRFSSVELIEFETLDNAQNRVLELLVGKAEA
ncbi:hypothetical protein [Deinococcus depolymerans]|uniref:REase AHJR-like domain-containing protein n=1 Tax=Deinococcus depolymerans TaxID=392408 RepID=A0ABN1CR09_9DEIO